MEWERERVKKNVESVDLVLLLYAGAQSESWMFEEIADCRNWMLFYFHFFSLFFLRKPHTHTPTRSGLHNWNWRLLARLCCSPRTTIKWKCSAFMILIASLVYSLTCFVLVVLLTFSSCIRANLSERFNSIARASNTRESSSKRKKNNYPRNLLRSFLSQNTREIIHAVSSAPRKECEVKFFSIDWTRGRNQHDVDRQSNMPPEVLIYLTAGAQDGAFV